MEDLVEESSIVCQKEVVATCNNFDILMKQCGTENHQIAWSDFDSRVSSIYDHLMRSKALPTMLVGIVIYEGFPSYFEDQVGVIIAEIPYVNIPKFPLKSNGDNPGKLIFSNIEGCNAIIVSKNIDYFDEYEIFLCKLFQKMGCEHLITFGVVTKDVYTPSFNVMVTKDHIDLTGLACSPLNHKKLCFPYPFCWNYTDYFKLYNDRHIKLALQLSIAHDNLIFQGTYIATRGPNYITSTEINMVQAGTIGKDSVSLITTAKLEKLKVASFYIYTGLPVRSPENSSVQPPKWHTERFVNFLKDYFKYLPQIDDMELADG